MVEYTVALITLVSDSFMFVLDVFQKTSLRCKVIFTMITSMSDTFMFGSGVISQRLFAVSLIVALSRKKTSHHDIQFVCGSSKTLYL